MKYFAHSHNPVIDLVVLLSGFELFLQTVLEVGVQWWTVDFPGGCVSRKRVLGLFVSFIGLMLFGFALAAHADTVFPDPNMDVSDPLCSPLTNPDPTTCPGAIGPGQSLNFNVSAHGGGIFTFTNIDPDPTHPWRALSITETGIPASAISCVFANDAFVNCTKVGDDPTQPTTVFFDDNGFPQIVGITFREEVIINLNNSCPSITDNNDPCPTGDSGGWIPGQTMTIAPNDVPEPATIAMLGTGALAFIRRRRK